MSKMATQADLTAYSAEEIVSLPSGKVTVRISQLKEWYCEEKLSMSAISDKLGCSPQSVGRLLDKVGVEKRTGNEQKQISSEKPDYTDASVLRDLYHKQGLSLTQIGSKFGVTASAISYWMDKHDIERREQGYDIPRWFFSGDHCYKGYPVLKGCDGNTIPEHYITLLGKGVDPHKLFSKGYNVDHKNREPADNRPENLQLLKVEEHGKVEFERNIDDMPEFDESDIMKVISYMMDPSVLVD